MSLDALDTANPTLYNARSLRLYDLVVQRISHRFIWRCPQRLIDGLYRAHMGAEHLEVGPGTGSTLRRTARDAALRDLTLLDINRPCLDKAEAAVAGLGLQCRTHQVGALQPWQLPEASVASVGCTDVLHCLPGNTIARKHALFDNAAAVLRDEGVFFGSTILGRTLNHSRSARGLAAFYNARANTFHSSGDSVAGLARVLSEHPAFDDVWIDVCGSIAMWVAWRAPRGGRK